jgi:hypothetical protein
LLLLHGVAAEDVAALMQRFGPCFPESVNGPANALLWAIDLLPWPELAPLLRTWVARGFTVAGLDKNDLAQRILAAFDGVLDRDRVAKLTLEFLLTTKFAAGACPGAGVKKDDKVDAAWGVAGAALSAYFCAVRPEAAKALDLRAGSPIMSLLTWLAEQKPDEQHEFIGKSFIDVFHTAATFVGRWSPPAAGAN